MRAPGDRVYCMAPGIQLGFCSVAPDEADVHWASPSFAPDEVDDAHVQAAAPGTEASAREPVFELIFNRTLHCLARVRLPDGVDAAVAEHARLTLAEIAAPLPGDVHVHRGEFVALGGGEIDPGEEVERSEDGTRLCRTTIETEAAKAFVKRLTMLFMFLIDGATIVDFDDAPERWTLFTAWRDDALLAAATTYTFVFPLRRVRICQFAVLPRHQRRGLGARLLNAIYAFAAGADAIEVSVEDPSAGFVALRDTVDASRAAALCAVDDGPPSADEMRKLQARLMLTREQAQRVVEILRLRRLESAPAAEQAVTDFRLGCKRRLLSAHKETLAPLETEARKRELGEMYDALTASYRVCAKKIGALPGASE